MIFSVDREAEVLEHLSEQELSELDILERENLEEWVIDEPRILGEDLRIITAEFDKFEDLYDRLDIMALDPRGNLVVVELKRDKADRTTDLQAIKYASYCATLTAEQIQQEYRDFWSDRNGESLTPEEVGQRFADYLDETATGEIAFTEDGWANFELDDRPRILLAAGRFGPEVTSPVMWLIQEFGMDITCTRIDAYKIDGKVLLNSQQVIPVPEAEEYMTKRREKQEKQKSSKQVTWTLPTLLDGGVLEPGDIVIFDERQVPEGADVEWNPEDDFWRARVTGDTGQQDNVEWLHNGETFSFTGLTREILHQLAGRDKSKQLNGYRYWVHPEFEWRTLLDLRRSDVKGGERSDEAAILEGPTD